MDGRGIELQRLLGQGGFGAVWAGRLRGGDGFVRQVAVKVMKEAGAVHPDVVARQRDEARLLGLLQHPNIVQVLDLTVIEGRPAVIMELVEGADLAALLRRRGALPLAAAIEAAAGVAAALDAGWTALSPETRRPLRVIHRDIKPANVLVTIHGTVKVLDFGVARADFDREGQTQSLAFGTPRFMAPEQFLGGEVGSANDVYALGVTLCELVTGRPWERPPLAPERFAERVAQQLGAAPEAVRPLLTRMLAYDANARPSAAEVLATLEAIPASGESLRTWARREVAAVMQEQAAATAASSPPVASGGSAAPHAAPVTLALPPDPAATPPRVELEVDSSVSLASPSSVQRRRIALSAAAVAGGGLLTLGALIVAVATWAWQQRPQDAEPSAAEEAPAEVAGPASPATAPAEPPAAQALDPAPASAPASGEPQPASSEPTLRTVSSSAPLSKSAPTARTKPAAAPPEPAPAEAAAPPATAPDAAPAAGPALAAPESPVKTRSLRVLADTIGAQVYLDGKRVGSTPHRQDVAYGQHTVELRIGDSAASRTFTIDATTSGTLRYLSAERRWVWEP